MTILELMNKRANLWENAKDFATSHEDKNGCLSAEDNATYEKMEADIQALTNEIERKTREAEMDKMLEMPVNSPITGKPFSGKEDEKTGRASNEYKNAMLKALRTNFKQIDNVLQEGVDEQGGYLVPEEYDRRLIDVLTEENIMRGLATTITTSGQVSL